MFIAGIIMFIAGKNWNKVLKMRKKAQNERIAINKLPEGLAVGNSLDAITELPDGLSVEGFLYLEGTAITEFPKLKV
jgi:hypothetical protein